MFSLNEIGFFNKDFWIGFLATSFPTALDEDTDMSLTELIEEHGLSDINWWNTFTKYYDGVLEETDGYIDEPETFICGLTSGQTLKIEFHPGDTIYYINDKKIACTGCHYQIQIFPFKDLFNFTDDKQVLLLLLPLVTIYDSDIDTATEVISNILQEIIDPPFCNQCADSIVYGLIKE